MTSILGTTRVLAATALLVLPCAAVQAVEPLTPAEESAVLRLARGTPTFAREWVDGIVPMQTASETLRRAALLARCAPLSSRVFSYLDAGHRAAVKRVLTGQQSLRSQYLGPSDGPVRNRIWLANFALKPGAERAAMVAMVRSRDGELLLRAESEDRVVDAFAELSVDIVTGEGEPAAVIWLKGYFEHAGRLPALRQAVAGAAPAQLADFDRVDGFERVGPADAPWLAALGAKLAERQEALRAALLKTYPPELRAARERAAAFRGEVQAMELSAQVMAVLASADPDRVRAVAEAARTLYPLPEGDQEAAAWNGMELPARAEVQRLCPPPASVPSVPSSPAADR